VTDALRDVRHEDAALMTFRIVEDDDVREWQK
jgi:hypothetical protein